MIFRNKEELIRQAQKDKACTQGILWCEERITIMGVKSEKTLEYIIENIPDKYRVWCISRRYDQFITQDFLDKLSIVDKKFLLIRYPELKNRLI